MSTFSIVARFETPCVRRAWLATIDRFYSDIETGRMEGAYGAYAWMAVVLVISATNVSYIARLDREKCKCATDVRAFRTVQVGAYADLALTVLAIGLAFSGGTKAWFNPTGFAQAVRQSIGLTSLVTTIAFMVWWTKTREDCPCAQGPRRDIFLANAVYTLFVYVIAIIAAIVAVILSGGV